ncbi:hypothetical protein SEUCBS139899_003190 [Sporothrix eucalyptigena]|uniref:Coiled-coil domain-containing protein 16 n=1 Tax=Sporothrix eucalyptigena TaxID=1812306 RepID=A0ABP0AZV5_9PEZI
MADVRALLRQQRTARRIDHPHAVYSDSGKLSCAVCRELVRPESAWDDHLRGALHRQNVRAVQAQKASVSPDLSNGEDTQHPSKRRHSETDDGDVEMSDGQDEPSRKKQHRPSTDSPKPAIEIKSPVDEKQPGRGNEPRKLSLSTQQQLTPPLGRRTSGTPAQGVEMRIPSRPATPIAHKDSFLGGGGSGSNSGSNSGAAGLPSAASTPKIAALGRSPLIPQEASSAAAPSATGPLNSVLNGSSKVATTSTTASAPALGISQAEIDEDEWAAFEAEVVNAPAAAEAARPGAKPDMSGGLVASAGAVSAEELAAAGNGDGDEDDRAKRRAVEEAQLADEKEEATRALQDEFEDMQELESRVQKLKEKREALRNNTTQPTAQQTLAPPAIIDDAAARRPSATMIDKENIRQQLAATHNGAGGKGQAAAESSDEDDDEEDEDDADWEAFRFRG